MFSIEDIRFERNMKLAATDWIVLRHKDELDAGNQTTLTSDQYIDHLSYRKALRDFPGMADPDNPKWPDAPGWMK